VASKLTENDVSEITRQSDVLSKPPRDNNTNFKNKINEIIDDQAAISVGTTNAETTSARPYHANLKLRLDSNWSGKQNYIKSGGAVTEQGTPNMTVAIAAGEAKINGIDCNWAAGNSGTVTAPGSNTRLDLVVAQSDSTLTIVTGSAAASPVFPSVASTQIVLAALVVKSTTTSLNEGTEIFTMKNFENPYFPNLYINAAYTATNKSHNNVIIDMSSDEITGTLECQGYCHIINYDNPGTNGTGESAGSGVNTSAYDDSANWTISNSDSDGLGVGTVLEGSSGPGTGFSGIYPYVGNAATGTANNLTINAFSIYILDLDISAGDGADGSTGYDPNTDNGDFTAGHFEIGSSGRDGANTSNLTFTAIDEIEILSGGTVILSGGDGGDGDHVNGGSVGNLGGDGGDGGDAGDLTYTCKTYTNNGTITQTGGSAGSGGIGSGGSDNNSLGTNGSAGASGSINSTLYDFTTGLPANYADWVHPLYTGYAL
jgi:hypothetical protein